MVRHSEQRSPDIFFSRNSTVVDGKYVKDGSVNSGSDTAWVEDIVITPQGGSGNGEKLDSMSLGLHYLAEVRFDARAASLRMPRSVFEWQILMHRLTHPQGLNG